MAFLVYIVVFAACVWIGVNAAKVKNYAVGLLTAGLAPFLLVFIFNLLYLLLFNRHTEADTIVNTASFATVLYAFLATPGAIISLVVFHMVRNQRSK